MIKTVKIKYHPKKDEAEFTVGAFVIIEHPFKTKKLIPQHLVYWANQLARVGLVFHSEYQGEYIFRVDGDVIHKIFDNLSLSEDSRYGSSSDGRGGDHAVKTPMSLTLKLYDEIVSSVELI